MSDKRSEKMTITFNSSMPEMLDHLDQFGTAKAKAERTKFLANVGLMMMQWNGFGAAHEALVKTGKDNNPVPKAKEKVNPKLDVLVGRFLSSQKTNNS